MLVIIHYSDMIERSQCATSVCVYSWAINIFIQFNARCNLFYKLMLIWLNQHYQIHNLNFFREQLEKNLLL